MKWKKYHSIGAPPQPSPIGREFQRECSHTVVNLNFFVEERGPPESTVYIYNNKLRRGVLFLNGGIIGTFAAITLKFYTTSCLAGSSGIRIRINIKV